MPGRVLVADDEAGIRSFLVGALEGVGHQVDTAAAGDEALAALRARAYDLLITDLKMPGLDGMALLTAIKEEQPEVEVIVLTAHGTIETAVDAMKRGAFDYLQKPVESLAELRIMVDRALERRRLISRTSVVPPSPELTWGAPSMAPVVDALQKVAPTDATVLLTGESGTGKEVSARYLHAASRRSSGPFVAVNCATLSGELLSSELFGHEKGAFTGAHERRRGRIELADGGTFFLDEVGELHLDVQAKLLRVLEERTFERLGGTQSITADVRWVAATNRDLTKQIGEGRFREDLFHRLSVFPIPIPPLRDRRTDIPPLAERLLADIAGNLGAPDLLLSKEAMAILESSPWPGNVRELRNTLERAAIMATGESEIRPEHLIGLKTGSASATTLADAERAAIAAALKAEGGNRKRAAERLQIGERTLYDKLKRYGL